MDKGAKEANRAIEANTRQRELVEKLDRIIQLLEGLTPKNDYLSLTADGYPEPTPFGEGENF